MSLIFIGGGGHARSCLDVARTAGYSLAGFYDRDPAAILADVPYLGSDVELREAAADCRYLITVGQVGAATTRQRLHHALEKLGCKMATLVASSAVVSPLAELGDGSVVLHHTLINAAAKIGVNCIINSGAIIEHDAQVGDHCHISTGVILNGGVSTGTGCMVGSRAVILQGVQLADNVIIGAGAVVNRDIIESGTWVGVPARRIK